MTKPLEYTPEPWTALEGPRVPKHDSYYRDVCVHVQRGAFIQGPNGEIIARADDLPEQGTIDGNMVRASECVNACKGINPEAVPDMMEALERIIPWLAKLEYHEFHSNNQTLNKRLSSAKTKVREALQKAKA